MRLFDLTPLERTALIEYIRNARHECDLSDEISQGVIYDLEEALKILGALRGQETNVEAEYPDS